MRLFIVLASAAFFVSCNNSGTASSFCDTTCKSDSFIFKGTDKFEATLAIGIKDCKPDSVSITHSYMGTSRSMPVYDITEQDVRLHASAIKCEIRDTSHAWLSFNDCITGRGFLCKFPFNKSRNISKYRGAINSFDQKFTIDPDLRAYTDRGSIYVINIQNDKEAVMTFKEEYNIDFNKIHEVLDSVNITKSRVYVKLKKNGTDVPIEKAVNLQ